MTFSRPIDDRYFEDYVEGAVHRCGSIAVEADEIVAFAKLYDPQSFHTDPEAAKRSQFGGLIASGWHTCAIAMRLATDAALHDSESFASPGVEKIRWPNPVRPGDELRLKATVIETRRARSQPTLGILRWRWHLFNASGDEVLDLEATSLFDLSDGQRP